MSFGDIDQDWLKVLERNGVIQSFVPADIILFQGQPLTHIGLIISGQADARVNSEHGDETWVAYFSPGDFLGPISLLTEAPIDFEICAKTEMRILFIPLKEFQSLMSSDAQLTTKLAKDIAARLQVMTARLVEAVTVSSPGRVCAELLRLSHPIGVDPDKLMVRPTPVFIDLALRINTTRETVSRTVSRLQKAGVLTREPGALLIHKPQALRTRIR